MPSNRKQRTSFSGNHQRSWLWGFHAVHETLSSGRWPVLEIYATEEAWQQIPVETQQAFQRVPLELVTRARIEELCHHTDHQGLLLRLGCYPYATLPQFQERLREQIRSVTDKQTVPLVVVCDRIQDSFNFGAILRCCDGVNVAGVIIGQRQQSQVTSHVVRSSSGATNHVTIVQTESLIDACRSLKSLGFQLVAADSNATDVHWRVDLKPMTALIVGSEALGVDAELLAMCDLKVTIPMAGAVTSLNVAVASGILLYEIRRQQA